MDQLPDARHEIGRIFSQQAVQKGRSRAGKPGNEDRPGDRLTQNFGRSRLLVMEPKEVRQESYDVPAGRDPSNQAQICFLETGAQEFLQRIHERRSAKLGQAGAASRQSNQLIGAQRPAQGRERIGKRIGDLEHGSLQHRQPFRPDKPERPPDTQSCPGPSIR